MPTMINLDAPTIKSVDRFKVQTASDYGGLARLLLDDKLARGGVARATRPRALHDIPLPGLSAILRNVDGSATSVLSGVSRNQATWANKPALAFPDQSASNRL